MIEIVGVGVARFREALDMSGPWVLGEQWGQVNDLTKVVAVGMALLELSQREREVLVGGGLGPGL